MFVVLGLLVTLGVTAPLPLCVSEALCVMDGVASVEGLTVALRVPETDAVRAPLGLAVGLAL